MIAQDGKIQLHSARSLTLKIQVNEDQAFFSSFFWPCPVGLSVFFVRPDITVMVDWA